jgi:hypothetical protein
MKVGTAIANRVPDTQLNVDGRYHGQHNVFLGGLNVICGESGSWHNVLGVDNKGIGKGPISAGGLKRHHVIQDNFRCRRQDNGDICSETSRWSASSKLVS